MADNDTTTLSYWLNWRFFLCSAFILTSMVLASVIIWKYEVFNKLNRKRRENEQAATGCLYENEVWMTSLKVIHPAWLLSFRMIAFAVLLGLLIANVIIDGAGIFYYYTQWTFTLVTIYFGLGSSFSIYGCCQNHTRFDGYRADSKNPHSERGSYAAPVIEENADTTLRLSVSSDTCEEPDDRKVAGPGAYILQTIYQTCSGAVLLTDSVFWLVLYPLLNSQDYRLNFLMVCMHSINAVFLLVDTILNCMRFPMFRMGYFVLWTSVYVIFQWIIHAFISMWWPYPFLELSSPYAPLWYAGVGLMHILCYGCFAIIIKLKQLLLARSFPESYQVLK